MNNSDSEEIKQLIESFKTVLSAAREQSAEDSKKMIQAIQEQINRTMQQQQPLQQSNATAASSTSSKLTPGATYRDASGYHQTQLSSSTIGQQQAAPNDGVHTNQRSEYTGLCAFRRALKQPDERVTDYAMRLRSLAQACEFGELLEKKVERQFVIGCGMDNVQRHCCRAKKGELNLAKVVDVAIAYERTADDLSELTQTPAFTTRGNLIDANQVSIQELLTKTLPIVAFSENMSQSPTVATFSADVTLKKWEDFDKQLGDFKRLSIAHFGNRTFQKLTFSFDNRPLTFISHDHITKKIMEIVDAIYQRIYPLKFYEALPPANGYDNKVDIVAENLQIEVKTNNLKVRTDLINDYSLHVIVKNAVNQVFAYTSFDKQQTDKPLLNFIMLSRFDNTWCFYRFGKNLYCSRLICSDQLIETVFFMLSISDPNNDFAGSIRSKIFECSIIDERNTSHKPENNILHSNENKPNQENALSEQKCATNKKRKTKQNKNYSINLTEQVIFEALLNLPKVGYGACGVVGKFTHQGKCIALKLCDLCKSKQTAIQEMTNESEIYKHINENDPDHKIAPKLLFSGNVLIYHVIATEYIEGDLLDFNSLNDKMQDACLTSLSELHKIGVLHGDVRGPNFIFQADGSVKLIDFGRSSIQFDESVLKKELTDLQQLISKKNT